MTLPQFPQVYGGTGLLGASLRRGPTVLFYDTFTGADETLLPDHTPEIGGAWSVFLSTDAFIRIVSNQANASHTVLAPTYPGAIGYSDMGEYNVSASLKFRPSANDSNGGIVLRLTDYANNWLVLVTNQTDALNIRERVAAVNVDRASVAVAVTAGQQILIEATAIGNTITASAGGQTISYESATFNNTATRHGINPRYQNDKIDDFTVTTP